MNPAMIEQEAEIPTDATSSALDNNIPSARPGLETPLVTGDFNAFNDGQYDSTIYEAKKIFTSSLAELGIAMPNSGMIWIASNVTNDTMEKIADYGRFLLDGGDLFIRKVHYATHSKLHSLVTGKVGMWKNSNGVERDIITSIAELGNYGGKEAEPDLGITTYQDSMKTNLSRVIIEIEVSHRSTVESLNQAEIYFQNNNVVSVVLLKVWPRNRNGEFAAAAVSWSKNNNDGNIACIERHDFGTRQIHVTARNNFARESQPNVPHEQHFLRTALTPDGHRRPHHLTIPHGDITLNGDALGCDNLPLTGLADFQLDLNECAEMIELRLPPYNNNANEDNTNENN